MSAGEEPEIRNKLETRTRRLARLKNPGWFRILQRARPKREQEQEEVKETASPEDTADEAESVAVTRRKHPGFHPFDRFTTSPEEVLSVSRQGRCPFRSLSPTTSLAVTWDDREPRVASGRSVGCQVFCRSLAGYFGASPSPAPPRSLPLESPFGLADPPLGLFGLTPSALRRLLVKASSLDLAEHTASHAQALETQEEALCRLGVSCGDSDCQSVLLSRASLPVTITAVDRAIAGGFEGHRGRDATLGAHRLVARAFGTATAAMAAVASVATAAATAATTTAASVAAALLLAGLSLLATRTAALGIAREPPLRVARLILSGVRELAAAILAHDCLVFERHDTLAPVLEELKRGGATGDTPSRFDSLTPFSSLHRPGALSRR